MDSALPISLPIIHLLRNTFPEENQLYSILQSLLVPSKQFFLRVNLTKIDQNALIVQLQPELSKYYNLIEPIAKVGPIPNSFFLPVFGPQKLPSVPKAIFVAKFAAEAILLGADLFIPGIKHISAPFHVGEDISIRLYMPKNSEFAHLHGSQVAVGKSTLESNQFPQSKHGILVKNDYPTYKCFPYKYSPLYQAGFYSEQTLGPMIAVAILMSKYQEIREKHVDPLIIDLCAAPGHKTTAMAEWGYSQMSTWPKIIAIDRSPNRLKTLHEEITRLGLQNIEIIPLHLEKILSSFPQLKEAGDLVLLDPPCSALGNRPKLFLEFSEDDLSNYANNQRRLLKLADMMVKPGGFLMYNTCTLPKEENEEIIGYALEKMHYKIVEIPAKYRTLGTPAITLPSLSQRESQNMMRLIPQPDINMGYFIGLLQKQE